MAAPAPFHNPDRRLTPRPLPAHLASAMLLWQSSRAALTNCRNGSPFSSAAPARLAALVAEIERLGFDRVAAALDRELGHRAAAFFDGLEAYRRHPFRRADDDVRVRWRHGSARLLDYRPGTTGPTVLIVPSLINRHYILDLLPERSFVRHLAAAGLRPLVLDWGEPGESERDFALADYIAGPLDGAAAAAVELAGGPVAICGYCMGGLLGLALALRRPTDTACLALLATPWDFHADRPAQAQLLGSLAGWLPFFAGAAGPVPVSVIQSLFLALDPFLAERKFIRFAGLDPEREPARGFVALEDWINDGVPLARPVALECARSWYGDNDPARGSWRVAGRPVEPRLLAAPALVVVPSRDRIVPPRSAEPLAAALPGATMLRPPLGHIGMMASAAAAQAVWQPIASWLRCRFGRAGAA
jgi:poly[(R)-3-hydroxyalkanoate] polymerase subunit PhaC